VRVPVDVLAAIDAMAERQGVTRAVVIRDALTELFGN